MFGILSGLKRLVVLGGASLLVVALFHDEIGQTFRNDPMAQQGGRFVQQGRQMLSAPAMYFAPDRNLESLDIERLRQTRSRLDISMYAFTDRKLAAVPKQLAQRGAVIRLYRDTGQFESEQARSHYGHPSTTDLLRGIANIHIRIKGGSARDLMHQKDYCINCRGGSAGVLREGSANWSVGAERFQDSSVWFTSDPRDTQTYEQKFDEMWNRPSNRIVQ